jgi:hypothetical protein
MVGIDWCRGWGLLNASVNEAPDAVPRPVECVTLVFVVENLTDDG